MLAPFVIHVISSGVITDHAYVRTQPAHIVPSSRSRFACQTVPRRRVERLCNIFLYVINCASRMRMESHLLRNTAVWYLNSHPVTMSLIDTRHFSAGLLLRRRLQRSFCNSHGVALTLNMSQADIVRACHLDVCPRGARFHWNAGVALLTVEHANTRAARSNARRETPARITTLGEQFVHRVASLCSYANER